MMRSAFAKNNLREIRHTLVRFLAILAIVALGVGFFAGLSVTRRAMLRTLDAYVRDSNMHDFRLLSSLGFDRDAPAALARLPGVEYAVGGYALDAAFSDGAGKEQLLKVLSISGELDRPVLTAGRMPAAGNECLADARYFSEEDIGTQLCLDAARSDGTGDSLRYDSYTVTGLANSVLYLNTERGTTRLGDGRLDAFLYLPEDGFDSEIYTELRVSLTEKAEVYSDAYAELTAAAEPEITAAAEAQVQARWQKLSDALRQAYGAVPDTLQEPVCYVLGRDDNVGYACFDSDASIVAGVARVFPPFFFLVAALVCVTTMTRMVDDQRTQIGVLKALGYGDGAVIRKYVSYAGSAALLGCLLGFFLGTLLFPRAIWMAYGIIYGFAGIRYVFDPRLLAVSVAVSLLCSVGTTWLACSSELRNSPAALMRPKAPKAGRRILLEHIPFLWRRMKFLHKVSARNILRYKKRLFMMVLGIAGCTALVLTGLGINDSVCNIVDDQFMDIMRYDYAVSFADGLDAGGAEAFLDDSAGLLDRCCFVNAASASLDSSQGTKSVNVIATDDPAGLTALIDLHLGDDPIPFPGDGELVISSKLAAFAGVGPGDALTLRLDGMNTYTATVSGVCENYVYHYAYLNAASYAAAYGEPLRYNQALATVAEGQDVHAVAAALQNRCGASAVSVVRDLRDRVAKMMDSMRYIVWLVIACAGALAFIVLCNLSNINISERVREIATIKVLGFYPGEVSAYVFRENFVLTGVGALLGLPLGALLHRFVMSQLKIDMVTFPVRIAGASYLYAVALTFLFTLLVDLIMRRKLNAISMADSLKSVE